MKLVPLTVSTVRIWWNCTIFHLGQPLGAVSVSVLTLCAVSPHTVVFLHYLQMITWMSRKGREGTSKHTHIPVFDDSLMTTFPLITPTVELRWLRHFVCCSFSYQSSWWTCLSAIFLSHLELFITHLTLYLTWFLHSFIPSVSSLLISKIDIRSIPMNIFPTQAGW